MATLHHPLRSHGLTLIELLIGLAVAAALAAIALPSYSGYMERNRIAQAVSDISVLGTEIERWRSNNAGVPPDSLVQLGMTIPKDPWNRNYVYLRIEGVRPVPRDVRRDKRLRPVNVDFDLYSVGTDGLTHEQFDHKDARDDVVRANGGAYVGLAGDY